MIFLSSVLLSRASQSASLRTGDEFCCARAEGSENVILQLRPCPQ